MKRIFLIFATILLLTSKISSADKKSLEELEKQEIAEKGYQTVNKLKSTYKEKKWDGYSWRYRENKYDINDKKMSKEKLLSTAWVLPIEYKNSYFDFFLMFYLDDVFKFGGKSAGVLVTGTYKIKNNKVYLYPEINDIEKGLNKDLLNKMNCFFKNMISAKLKYSSNDIIFANELIVDNLCFYPSQTFKENGKKGFVKDIPVYTQIEEIVMTESVPFYSLPDINSKKLSNWIYMEIYNIDTNCLVKGSVLNILGKTQKKSIINGTEDNWYYVRIFESDSYYHGWFFGQNFEKYDKTKNKEYQNILKEEIQKYK